MMKRNITLLYDILKMSQEDLYNYLKVELKKYYTIIDSDYMYGSYIYCKGSSPVLLVAHLDTVFESPSMNVGNYGGYKSYFPDEDYNEMHYDDRTIHSDIINSIVVEDDEEEEEEEIKEIFYDSKQAVMWSPDGLGADDRAGVFMILTLLRSGLRPSVLFTTDEEIGGIGAKQFALNYKKSLVDSNIKYILELDRSGYQDCVFYDCDNPNFEEYINSFGFKTEIGTFSDISIICPAVGIAGVNLSVGYVYEHTLQEMLYVFSMFNVYDTVCYMIKDSKNIYETFDFMKKRRISNEFSNIISFKTDVKCAVCDGLSKQYIKIDKIGFVCTECYKSLI